MRADSGPLAIFGEGARRLIRAPLPLAALWLVQAIATHALQNAPSVSVLDLEAWTDPRAGVTRALWFVASTFLWGAMLTRYAHPGTTGMSSFLAGGRAFFGRMLRLSLLTMAIFYGLHVLTAPDRPTEGALMVEFRLTDWLPLAPALFLQLFVQLGEVRTIVEDRRSVLFALTAGGRLLAARPVTVLVVYAIAALTLIVGFVFMLWVMFWVTALVWRVPDWAAVFSSQFATAAILLFNLQISASLIALYQEEMARLRPEYDPAEASSGWWSRLNELTAKE